MGKVYFMNARARSFLDSYAIKGRQLFEMGGFESAVSRGDTVAIKVHMGEAYTCGYLRPNIVRAFVDKVKELGGKPFVTDTTTMPYHPWISRSLAIDYLETANQNGFTHSSMGCPVIIADGWVGTDDVTVNLKGRGNYLKKQFIARAIADADVLISLAHFKGHPAGGYGGSIKNVGVGCASKRGKMNIHGALAGDKPIFHKERCVGKKCVWWKVCEQCCPEEAIKVTTNSVEIDFDECVYCFACANLCANVAGYKAIERFDDIQALGCRIADSALACTLTKKKSKIVYINFALDVSTICDCYGWTDAPIVNDIGILASQDPVSLDKACIDLLNAAEGLKGSAAEDANVLTPGAKKLNEILKRVRKCEEFDVETQIYGGNENGLGSVNYELIAMETIKSKEYMEKIYPEVPACKLKNIYKRQHPLAGVNCPSFGKPTRDVEGLKYPVRPSHYLDSV